MAVLHREVARRVAVLIKRAQAIAALNAEASQQDSEPRAGPPIPIGPQAALILSGPDHGFKCWQGEHPMPMHPTESEWVDAHNAMHNAGVDPMQM